MNIIIDTETNRQTLNSTGLATSVLDKRKQEVVFLGSPLIDITTNIDRQFLQHYNLQPDNAYSINTNTQPIFEEIKKNAKLEIGGSVTNTVRIFRKLWNFPEAIAYFGSIGNDQHGQLIKNKLTQESLAENLMEITGEKTGKVAVLLMKKTRTLITDLGASRIFPLNSIIIQKIDSASLIYLSAFFINVSWACIERVMKSRATLAVNLGAPFLTKKFPREILAICNRANLIFGNENEFLALTRILNISNNNLGEIPKILEQRARTVIVTRSDKAILVLSDGKSEEFAVKALNDETIIDTNGAGDVFVGGFLARYVEGESIANCVQCGIQVARQVIQSVGCNLTFS